MRQADRWWRVGGAVGPSARARTKRNWSRAPTSSSGCVQTTVDSDQATRSRCTRARLSWVASSDRVLREGEERRSGTVAGLPQPFFASLRRSDRAAAAHCFPTRLSPLLPSKPLDCPLSARVRSNRGSLSSLDEPRSWGSAVIGTNHHRPA